MMIRKLSNFVYKRQKGVSLVELMLASLVVAIITGIILRNYIADKQREVYRNLAQVLVAFDKGVFDASMLVESVNSNLRPILPGTGNTSGSMFSIDYTPSRLVANLQNTRNWITPQNFPNFYDSLNQRVPVNLLDPRLQAGRLDDRYKITAWFQAVDADGNSSNGISPNPITNRYRYALFELEIRHADGSQLTDAETDVLYALLKDKFCVDGSGSGHYALAGGSFKNGEKNCPNSKVPANYYTVELQ
ncbi:MAG: prepilin-type N-terminal cleavage/methylation domain-containing protein [Thermodesulfobacterium sp.]|jgi:type II secretory pathway pseudopilin PulG|nr:prepilin-type N-terminal cleavage/methylation domain-containing protein [Thermodesulfobacterium sp.]